MPEFGTARLTRRCTELRISSEAIKLNLYYRPDNKIAGKVTHVSDNAANATSPIIYIAKYPTLFLALFQASLFLVYGIQSNIRIVS